jgi:hypothetical protein
MCSCAGYGGCLDGEGSAKEVLVHGLDAEEVDDAGEEEEDHEDLRNEQRQEKSRLLEVLQRIAGAALRGKE